MASQEDGGARLRVRLDRHLPATVAVRRARLQGTRAGAAVVTHEMRSILSNIGITNGVFMKHGCEFATAGPRHPTQKHGCTLCMEMCFLE